MIVKSTEHCVTAYMADFPHILQPFYMQAPIVAKITLKSCIPQVFDPLLEKGKGKFSKHAAKEKKLNSEWRQTGGGSERPRMT